VSSRLEIIERMIAAGSGDSFHHYARAMELRSLGRCGDALVAFEDVRERFPDYVPTYLMAAQVAQELDREQDARRWAEWGIERAVAVGDAHSESELRAFASLLG